ncbi:MAG TPA: hypothetical protein VD860_11200, partial [Azospirillum sp.]|nr:hypothetical protein [Azospirillum sp.]
EAFLAKVDLIAEAAFDDQCTGANPRFPLVAELKRILIDSYYGRATADDGLPAAEPAKARKKEVSLVHSR